MRPLIAGEWSLSGSLADAMAANGVAYSRIARMLGATRSSSGRALGAYWCDSSQPGSKSWLLPRLGDA